MLEDITIDLGMKEYKEHGREGKARSDIWNVFLLPNPLTWVNFYKFRLSINIVRKHIWLSKSFTNRFYLFSSSNYENFFQRASQAVSFPVWVSEFSMLFFVPDGFLFLFFTQSSRLTAVFHLENNANIPPLWISGQLDSLMCAHTWAFMR